MEAQLGVLQDKFKKLELEDTSLKEDQKNTNVKRKKVMQLLKMENILI